MLLPDVNVFVNVETTAAGHHGAALRWLEAAAGSPEAVGVPEMVLLAFIRVTTGAAMGDGRITPARAFEVVASIRRMPSYQPLTEGPRHWPLFEQTVRQRGISGPATTDAYLAAFALEHDATFVTFDRGFQRFPGLRLQILE